MVLLYIIIYLTGSILGYGIATWIQYKSEASVSRFIRPDYVKSYHNPLAIIGLLFSWASVLIYAIAAKELFGKIKIQYNYKSLWDNWNKKNN
tara:strand:+ start:1825 stop:2100 length:276 start_codon:yes stop_codon:yes gene_type:complete